MTWLSGERLDDAIARTQGRSRGFDYLRILLSCAVVLWHSARVTFPDFGMGPILRPTAGLILPMFFALSGYLISGSLVRSRSIHEFIALRAIRIMPALAVETLLSLFIIGTIFTTLPLREFYSHGGTWAYLWNLVGHVHLKLPGVFKDNPLDYVNISLWTVPYELECYALVAVLWVTRIIRLRWALLAAAIALQLLLPAIDYYREVMPDPTRPVAARILILSFLYGIIIFQFRDKLRLSAPLLLVAIALCVVTLSIPSLSYFVAAPAAYVTVYFGLRNPPKVPVVMNGDYSYGIYLYAFPLQQVVYSLSTPDLRLWWINGIVSLVLASGCAAFSWHVVEKPILARRKHIVGAADRFVDNLRGRRLRPDPATVAPMDRKADD